MPEWEIITSEGDIQEEGYAETVERLRIPGGWLIRATRLDEDATGELRPALAVTIIPFGMVTHDQDWHENYCEHCAKAREKGEEPPELHQVLPFKREDTDD
jgi:hypothetical protein